MPFPQVILALQNIFTRYPAGNGFDILIPGLRRRKITQHFTRYTRPVIFIEFAVINQDRGNEDGLLNMINMTEDVCRSVQVKKMEQVVFIIVNGGIRQQNICLCTQLPQIFSRLLYLDRIAAGHRVKGRTQYESYLHKERKIDDYKRKINLISSPVKKYFTGLYLCNLLQTYFMKNWILIISASLFIISCKKEDSAAPPAPLAEQTMPNTPYGADAAQKMDIYLPAGRTTSTTKVIILIHGGGWSSGDKADFTPFVDTLKRRIAGYAIFNLNYRLAAGASNLFPTQENDVKAAIEFIYSKRNDYKISDKYVLLGASAGGHLSLLQAYKYTSPVKIKAVVDFFGPTDMVDMYNNPASIFAPPAALAAVIGGIPATHLALYQQSSPVTFVTAQTSPTIILQGGVDPLVAPAQSVALKNKLQTSGVVHQYVFYPTESHGWTGPNMVDSFDKITVFLNANVN